MNKMKNITILFALALVVVFSSCEDVIPVELDNGQTLLCVQGTITDDTSANYSVVLSTTAPYFGNTATPKVSGAFVEVKDYDTNGNLVSIDTLLEALPGSGEYFTSRTNGMLGHRYVLTVRAMNEEYTAETLIKRVPEIDSIVFEYKEKNAFMDAGYIAKYYGIEIPGVGDYYLFKIRRNQKLYTKPNELYFVSDEMVDGNYIADFDLSPERFSLGDTITFETRSITKDQYEFFLELSAQVNNQGIFANPPANVRTNIKNVNPAGKPAVGYFGGQGLRTKTRVIE